MTTILQARHAQDRQRLVRACESQWARRTAMAFVHAALWTSPFGLALVLRFEGLPPQVYAQACKTTVLLLVGLQLAIFTALDLFTGLWRYTGLRGLQRIVLASSFAILLVFLLEPLLSQPAPRSLLIGAWLASVVAVGGARMLIRGVYEHRRRDKPGMATLVVGLNVTGERLVDELQRDETAWKVVGILDSDPAKRGEVVHGVPVLGPANAATLRKMLDEHQVEQVLFAIPSSDSDQTRQLLLECRRQGVRTKTVPSLVERLAYEPLGPIGQIDIDELLRREPVRLDVDQVAGFLKHRVVLVTGAGGSIGSELARQVLRFGPSRLLLLDHDENALFHIERELRDQCGECVLGALVVDITDQRRVDWVFEAFSPEIVLHAAAHKHVAMMESNACEAARNNALGTQLVAQAAHAAGSKAFVLISTDKAVNPTSVMGSTKRVCEMVIQQMARRSSTRFAAVRFGNVLGSNGSVVPLFREQIARGGPVTVTHPEAARHFMTIPEAAQLVLQAGALGHAGQIFMLDMGQPIKIVDLARDLIALSGLRPGVDIQIEYCGLKPGEKVFEELLRADEESAERPHPKIVVCGTAPPPEDQFARGMESLVAAIQSNDDLQLRQALAKLVPEATLAMPSSSRPIHRPRRIRAGRSSRVAEGRNGSEGRARWGDGLMSDHWGGD